MSAQNVTSNLVDCHESISVKGASKQNIAQKIAK
jgi:hypothetical protein